MSVFPFHQPLYHYTSIDALDKIIKDGDDIDNKICLLATDHEYFNDPGEVYHGVRVALPLLQPMEDELSIPLDKRISQYLTGYESDIKNNTWFGDVDDKNCPSIFMTSFSKGEESLNMWNMYASKGNGIALVFEWMDIWTRKNLTLKPVTYDNDKDGIKGLIESYYTKISKAIPDKKAVVSLFAGIIGAKIKSHHYLAEQEWRLILASSLAHHPQMNGIISPLKFRVRDGVMIPYHEVYYPAGSLRQIIVGPTRNFDQTKKSIQMFLYSRGLMNVEVIKSTVPYRN